MGRAPCCDKNGLKKGPWTPEEDQKLMDYIQKHGYGNWRLLPKNAGLQRCGKSCRLRWTNYLRPDIKRGRFSFEEEETIIQLHSILGNKWSAIASRLPGRTDNEIKNYWNTHIRKRLLRMGIDPVTHSPRLDLLDLSSILSSSLYATSNINIQRLLGTQTLVNPELLKFASSLFSSQQNAQENHLYNYNPQIQNQISQFPQSHQDSPLEASRTLNDDPTFSQAPLVESNINSYPSISPHLIAFQQQHDWHCNEIASCTETDHAYVSQLPTSYNDYHASLMENFHSNNNFNLASVLSTPSSSPTPLNSNSTYFNGSYSTEDETESYVSSNILRFEIPDMLGVNEFM